MTTFAIRPYHPTDLTSLYRICLQTGDHGRDATLLYRDPDLLGHIYAAPYAVFEPDLCFLLTRNAVPCGYILGTRDSVAFGERCERDWLPPLRARYPLPEPTDPSSDAWAVRSIHASARVSDEELQAYVASYPAHLHIDLLPEAQQQGWGRKLMERFWHELQEMGVTAVHLGVSRSNPRAVAFYKKLGYRPVHQYPKAIMFGIKLLPVIGNR
ncbi:MAG: GNAT family N-acetyltransferase [Anaerolineales bacterium]|nr:GNAT family N-acetyltransferase [Anaerolineales bacterium]